MRLTIIGFNDEIQKYHGPTMCFREEDRFLADELPPQIALRAYAERLGYLPRIGKGISQTKCEPVYTYNGNYGSWTAHVHPDDISQGTT